MEIIDHYGFSINSPVYPPVVPRFKTMNELTGNMSQVITNFTTIETVITAEYNPAIDSSIGSFMFGIQLEKEYEHEVSFSSSVSLGDFATLAVKDSSLRIEGSFGLLNEFNVKLGSNQNEGLKSFSQVKETNCTTPDQNVNFDVIIQEDDDSPITRKISISSCVEGVVGRVEAVKSSVSSVVGEENITVSLVGDSTLVFAFHPKYSKVKLVVPETNIYGLKNDTIMKSGYHFEIGAGNLDLSLGVSGAATVSARVLDTIEAEATIIASMDGDLQFNSGTQGQFVPMDTWFSDVRAMFNESDEFHNSDFASCTITLNGDFEGSAAAIEPFYLEYPEPFTGYFNEPFNLNVLNLSEVKSSRPDITLDIDLPTIGEMSFSCHVHTAIVIIVPHPYYIIYHNMLAGDIKKLSVGDVVKFMDIALGFLVGNREKGDSVESCSGGLLGKEINGKKVFTYNIPILGFSICDFVRELQIVVDAIDQLVNDCTECTDSDSPKSTFTLLETKLNSLLQDAVGGSPSVVFTPASDASYSSLEIDITLEWSLPEAFELNIDLASILEGMDLDEDLKNFVKGFIAFEGGVVELVGAVSFGLGVGLEYNKVVSLSLLLLCPHHHPTNHTDKMNLSPFVNRRKASYHTLKAQLVSM